MGQGSLGGEHVGSPWPGCGAPRSVAQPRPESPEPGHLPPPPPSPVLTLDFSSKLARLLSRCSACARLLPTSVKVAIFWDTVSKVALTCNRGAVSEPQFPCREPRWRGAQPGSTSSEQSAARGCGPAGVALLVALPGAPAQLAARGALGSRDRAGVLLNPTGLRVHRSLRLVPSHPGAGGRQRLASFSPAPPSNTRVPAFFLELA